MMAFPEKRASERRRYNAPIEVSYFNKPDYFYTQTLNHCADGMFFKSNFFLQPGTTILIRIKNFHPNDICTGLCEGLRSVTLAEVKWCREIHSENDRFYGTGVKYYESDY